MGQDEVNSETGQGMEQAAPSLEACIVIGHQPNGEFGYALYGVNAPVAVVMLEQVKNSIVNAIKFQKERKILPFNGPLPPVPNGNGKSRF